MSAGFAATKEAARHDYYNVLLKSKNLREIDAPYAEFPGKGHYSFAFHCYVLMNEYEVGEWLGKKTGVIEKEKQEKESVAREQRARKEQAAREIAAAKKAAQKAAEVPIAKYTASAGSPYLQTFKLEELHDITKIFEGGFGIVYTANFGSNKVAVKILPYSNHDDENKFGNEAGIMCRLLHPKLVKILGTLDNVKSSDLNAVQSLDRIMLFRGIVMEYMPDGTLDKYLKSKDLDWRPRLIIAEQIACGLEYIHRNGVLHRDLKSPNVLLEVKKDCLPTAKICDFGMACKYDPIYPHAGKYGTEGWIAPEVYERKPFTFKADIFSLAIVLWEIAEGKLPWDGYRSKFIEPKVIAGEREEISPDRGTPLEYQKIILEAWQQKPEDRPSTVVILSRLRALIDTHDCGFTKVLADKKDDPNISPGFPASVYNFAAAETVVVPKEDPKLEQESAKSAADAAATATRLVSEDFIEPKKAEAQPQVAKEHKITNTENFDELFARFRATS